MATSTDLNAILSAAAQGSYIAQLSGGTYTVSQTITIYINHHEQGIGLNGGGATIISQVPAGQPVIQFVVGPGVDFRYLELSNFTIQGNGSEGDGIKVVADGMDRDIYNWNVDNVTVNHVGGYGLHMYGNVFEGLVSNSWMNNNGKGGALFEHSTGGGQVSALRWFGGGAQNNNGPGILLDHGGRDLSVDGASFVGNHGDGINAMWGIMSVTGSTFQDNQGNGIRFDNYGNFNNDTFTTTGVQTVGINGYLTGGATLLGDTSHYTGTGTDPTLLAKLTGNAYMLAIGDTGRIVTGPGVIPITTGSDDHSTVQVTTQGASAPALAAITAATTAAVANSTGTSPLETALKAAMTGGTVGHLQGTIFNVSAPIVINLTSSTQGPIGIDLGGADINSTITNGQPVIEIIVGPGVNIGTLALSNFTMHGSFADGDGIKIVVNGTDRSIGNLKLTNVNVEAVGGIGLDVVGNVSHAAIFNSWMHADMQGGARFAGGTAGGVPTDVQWIGGGFRKNGTAGLILDNGAHDVTVKGAYFVENLGPGINATSGITLVQASGFENNAGVGAMVNGAGGSFTDDTFSTYGPQTLAVAGRLTGGEINMTGTDAEYYGGGSDPTALANIQGTGTLNTPDGGKVLVGPGVAVNGANPVLAGAITPPPTGTPPALTETLTTDTGFSSTDKITSKAALTGTADANAVIHFAVDGSSVATTATANASGIWSLTPTGLGDGQHTIVASETNGAGVTGTASLAFTLDTTASVITSIAASGPGITAGNGVLGAGKVVTFTVNMSETVWGTGTGTPTLVLNDGGTAIYTGGSGTPVLTFSHTVATGQNTADLAVLSLNFPTGALVDAAGNTANLAGATNYNPAGTLQISTMPATAPVVTVSLANDSGASPTDKITSNPGLAGTADPGATVRFTVDGVAIAATAVANASGAWSYTATGLADGTHVIVASETNTAGATGTASLAFTLDRTAPVLTEVFVPANGTAGAMLTGTGDPNATVRFTVDGSTWAGSATADSTGAWSYSTAGMAPGAHTVVASETDGAGNTGTASLGITLGSVPVGGGSAGAGVAAISLANDTGASSTDRITNNAALKGTADPNGVVHFTIDGSAITAAATANASGAWSFAPAGLADGTHTIVASETGAAATASLSFTLDTRSPVTVLDSAVVANGQVTLTGHTGGASDSVQVYDGSSWLGIVNTAADGTFSFKAPAPSTVTHDYGAFATDLAGNQGGGSNHLAPGSAPTGNPPAAAGGSTTGPMPTVTISLLNDTGALSNDAITADPSLKGMAEPGAAVHFTVDGAAVAATASVDTGGGWSFLPTGLADGLHTIMASETNAAGATGAAFLTFTLAAQAPIPSLTGVSVANGQATLAGTTGAAGTQVNIYDGSSWIGATNTGSDGTWHFTASAASGAVHTYGIYSVDAASHFRPGLNKLMLGSTAADALTGGPGGDVMTGNGGNDVITGGAGADILTGGTGRATFAYNAAADSTAAVSDTITDFRAGSSKLDFTNIAGIGTANGSPLFQGNITGTGNVTLNAHSVAYLEVGGMTQVLVNASNAAETVSTSDMHAADMKIGLVGVHLGLAATDFLHV